MTTGEEGAFLAAAIPGTYRLALFRGTRDAGCDIGWYGGTDGYTVRRWEITALQVPRDADADIVIKLPRPLSEMCRTISGIAINTDGEPVARLWVSADPQHDQESYSGQESSVEGRFELLVRVGGAYEIHLHSNVARECTVEEGYSDGERRPAIAVQEDDITGVRVVVVTGPPRPYRWIACGPGT